ncbi:DNA gyrase inhibitor YacG [Ottowia thiooxydans]|uniref:DNA gyrase inhibitor YacG n=1 Tax=Ottowia thiooxydans TaxID=219182 RepID=UPI0003F5BDC0|nr:DNA gyrase inhibitor YacG [Ottowia thiooxydans]
MSTPPTPPQKADKPRTVRCPACSGPSLYSPENIFRPFCSERCKMHDLGAWASESFRMEVQEDDGATTPESGVPLQ